MDTIMPKETLKQVLMRRDDLTSQEADDLMSEARADLYERLEEGDIPMDICEEWFGLEPDYLDELVPELF